MKALRLKPERSLMAYNTDAGSETATSLSVSGNPDSMAGRQKLPRTSAQAAQGITSSSSWGKQTDATESPFGRATL